MLPRTVLTWGDPLAAMARAKKLPCGNRVRVAAGNCVGKIALQGDHLLMSGGGLLSIELSLLDSQHGADSLFVFLLSERGVCFSHGSFGLSFHLGGIQDRTGCLWR